MGLSVLKSVAVFALIELSAAKHLATVTPCPDCRPSIAPKPIVVTAQYQTVSTCEPSTTTVVYPYTKSHTTDTSSRIETIASCSPYAWVSTTIPVYHNWTKTASVVTTTNQPVTFNSLHYTETFSTTITLLAPKYKGNGTYGRNVTHPSTTVKYSHTTIDVKDYCDYNSIGPIAIPGYKGSGLCTDCGPDANSALTQRFTVVSCSNMHCTTFDETWIETPKTYSSEGQVHTTKTTKTYCPTATPETAMPGYTHAASTGLSPSASPQPTPKGPSASAYPTSSSVTLPSQYSSTYGTVTAPPSYYRSAGSTATDDYGTGSPEPTATEYDGGGTPDPSGDGGYEDPTPTPYQYQSGPSSYKVFKRQGLEKPRGRVMKRSGLLFWGS